MKTATVVAGVVGAILITLGSIFKIQHWPFSTVAILLGVMTITVVYNILNTIRQYKVDSSGLSMANVIVGGFTLSTFLIALAFKMQHWPGAIIIALAGILWSIIYIPIFVLKMRKGSSNVTMETLLPLLLLGCMTVMIFGVGTPRNGLTAMILIDNTQHNLFEINNAKNTTAFDKLKISGANLNAPNSLSEVFENGQSLISYIEELKMEVIAFTDGVPVEHYDNFYTAHDEDGNTGLWKIMHKDNYDKPTYFLLGSPENRSTEYYSAYQLHQLIVEYNSSVRTREDLSLNPESDGLEVNMVVVNDAGVLEDWAIKTFDHLPIVAVVANLSMIQNQVVAVQSEILTHMNNVQQTN